ncbi:MAG: hypothetical protein SFV54_19550 [Bryobacteraceae bacterium]|nr:hypothetical protein [Bryobacteraceae bacterium]
MVRKSLFAFTALAVAAIAQTPQTPQTTQQPRQQQQTQPQQRETGSQQRPATGVEGSQAGRTDATTGTQSGSRSGMTGSQAGSADCQQMMTRWNTVMADLRAADQRLEQRVAAMNAATGTDRTDAMAALLTELATQHRTAIRQMNEIHTAAFNHMRTTSSGSAGGTMTAGAGGCPAFTTLDQGGQVGQ